MTQTMPSALARGVAAALAARPEAAGHHVRFAIQVLLNLMELGALDDRDRRDVRAALHRLFLSLREIDRGNT